MGVTDDHPRLSVRERTATAGYAAATPEVADSDASTLVRNPKVTGEGIERQNAIATQVSVASVTEMYLTGGLWRRRSMRQRLQRLPGSPSCTAWS